MKHLLIFFLIALLITLFIFAALCLSVSFDDTPAISAHYCRAHGLFAIKLTLPEESLWVRDAFSAAIDALPDAITAPPRVLLQGIGGLLREMREAYEKETAGCTAFS